ncbi:hypothetical protein RE6C_01462 [Rhodopirellula europaea 6C]|uniref:Uncharacterized protein n=1 Tax=Rhodopirellula europaea 6C TaxID=1263867 RepID=M2A844_9BACT|nr:hypothetical protein RE6C_01462 [Rhodopirellula europaea 6C]
MPLNDCKGRSHHCRQREQTSDRKLRLRFQWCLDLYVKRLPNELAPGPNSKLIAAVRASVVHPKRLQADPMSTGRTRTSRALEIPHDLFDDVSKAHSASQHQPNIPGYSFLREILQTGVRDCKQDRRNSVFPFAISEPHVLNFVLTLLGNDTVKRRVFQMSRPIVRSTW